MTNSGKIKIDPLSLPSLLVSLFVNKQLLGTATGFIVEKDSKYFLVTNWHVVSGRNSNTNQPSSHTGGLPDEIQILLHSHQLGLWIPYDYQLLDPSSGKPMWLEHPKGREVDVVAIRLGTLPNGVQPYPMDRTLANADLSLMPGMPVFIIGFPFGISAAAALPIWKTGHLASDHDIDYNGKPSFLIDATTRGGMSGSPVVARMSGGHYTSKGFTVSSRMATRFLGVYSGRIREDSEIGIVWRPSVIDEILSNE